MTSASAVGLRSERGPILLAVMVATALVAIDATVVATAVTSITQAIGGYEAYSWLFSIYLLAQSVTVPVYSKLADTIGRKKIVLLGVGLFLLGSILCSVAWSMPALIVFRAIQGLGAGAILPITVTIIGDIYTLQERARVQGYVAAVWGAAAVIGPTLGGLFAQYDIWRGIFVINVPLCLVAIWLLARNYHEKLERHRHRIDVAGAALLSTGLLLVLLGVSEGGVAWAWDSPTSIGIFAAGVAVLIAFVFVERRAAEPVLPLWVFTRPVVVVGVLLGLGIGGVTIGFTAFVPEFLQVAAGIPQLPAGLALATMTIGWPVAASLSGRLYLRFGFRNVVIVGGALATLGATAVWLLTPLHSVWATAAVLVVVGLGLGFAAVPSLVAAQTSVPWHERGVATGANMMARSLGNAVGAAVLGAIVNGVIAAHGGSEADPAAVIPASAAAFLGSAVIALAIFAISWLLPRSVTSADPDPVTPRGDAPADYADDVAGAVSADPAA